MSAGTTASLSAVTARHVIVHGRVQGVFFRDSTRREARRHGVVGWVANRPDGTVEAWFEGPDEAVDALVRWCHHGPPRAAVERVEVERAEPRGLAGFEIR
jgi:acylphosphatase